ncbi:MAG: hypothetical protein IKQ22_00730 [Clostridia bacterium]|nr:hypothetical protein [Clostridia bacterium]
MESGQKIDINLESPLDTKSSDMLVSVNDIKFAHNRQRYQGHVLPTSLRYEQNGWAAGWYVYDFKVDGGNILSSEEYNGIKLSATRTRINNTPTYILEFKIADWNGEKEEHVPAETQFRTWYTLYSSVRARECREASITDAPMTPELSFNYAIDNVDYEGSFVYNYNVKETERSFTETSISSGLALDYVDQDQDGTVHALLTNNNVTWNDSYTINVPKDILLNNDGDIFAEFNKVVNGTVYYNIPILGLTDILSYHTNHWVSDTTDISINSNVASMVYPVQFNLIVPLNKAYISFNNISWAIQGNKTLFSQASQDDPLNKYYISIENITEHSFFYNNPGSFNGTAEINGPDVSILSKAEFDLNYTISGDVSYDEYTALSVYTISLGTRCTVPVLTGNISNFKLPGADTVRDVTVQVYLIYPGERIKIGTLGQRDCYMSVITYPYSVMAADLWPTEPVFISNHATEEISYTIDGKNIPSSLSNPVDITRVQELSKPHIASRNIVGRVMTFTGKVQSINGTSFTNNDSIDLQITGINTNLLFQRYVNTDWYTDNTAQINTGGVPLTDYGVKHDGWEINNYSVNEYGAIVTYSFSIGTDGKIYKYYRGYPDDATYVGDAAPEKLVTSNGSNFIIIGLYNSYIPGHTGLYLKISYAYGFYLIPWSEKNTFFTIEDVQSGYVPDGTVHDYRLTFKTSQLGNSSLIKILNGADNLVYYNSLNNVPNRSNTNTISYNPVVATNNGCIQTVGPLPTLIMNFRTGSSVIGIPAANANINNIEAFEYTQGFFKVHEVEGDTRLFDTSDVQTWVTTFNQDIDIESDSPLLPNFCFDIMDNKTGELLVDHAKDVLTFSEDPSIHVYLDATHLVTGKLFFPSHMTNTDLSNYNLPNYISNIHKIGNIGNAFFPISKYIVNRGSIFSEFSTVSSQCGACQGIAIFNTFTNSIAGLPDGYYMQMLSPLAKYVLPPRIENEKLVVYAQRTFTHKIQFDVNDNSLGNSVNLHYIDDSYTDLSKITVIPRSNIYSTENNDDIENNNKYYESNTLLKPAAISYYDDKIHVTWQASKGTSLIIEGTAYDLSTSELSIKMIADLGKVLLPQYFTSGSENPLTGEPYHITLGNDFTTFRTNEIKEIQQSINDIDKSKAYIHINSITPTQSENTGLVTARVDIDTYMLVYPIIRENLGTTHFAMSYTDSFTETDYNPAGANQQITFDREYSSDSQMFIKQKVKVTSTIQLPSLSGISFINNSNSITEISDNGNTAHYDYINNKVVDMVIQGNNVSKANISLLDAVEYSAYTKYVVSINQAVNTDIYFKHVGIYKIDFNAFDNGETHTDISNITYSNGEYTFNDCNLKRSNGTSITGLDFSFNFNDFEDKTKCKPKYLDYSATDVRTSETKYFARVLCDNEYQLIKQQWDSTVETENFWWLDDTHILCLTKDELIVKEKGTEYDDWAGDTWEIVNRYNRIEYITSEADKFLCSSVKGKDAKAYLYILSPVSETSLQVTVYNPLDNMLSHSFTIVFKHVALGEELPLDECNNGIFTLYSYSDILSTSIISDSKLTAVELGNKHWLGIQYDKNLNQWAIQLKEDGRCVRGYGCIGINGYATGGMLPKKYFNTEMTVQPIDALEAETDIDIKNIKDFNKFNERIVGDENQQWYISEKLEGIVIAVDLTDTTKQIVLPITNKYAQVYSSPSYAKYTVHAFGLQIKQLIDLFTTEQAPLWKQIIKYAMFPVVWFLSPYTDIINYLQQTLGQYAYVHYNTTSIGKRRSITGEDQTTDNAGLTEDENKQHIDALTMDDLSFDVQHIAQEQSFRDNAWDNILGIFMSMVVSATDYSVASLSVNSLQNQSAISDIGRKFSQAFSQNIGSMSVTGFNMQSTKPMLKSEVTAVKTLDMFYSTSAEQKCFAGPGYVNTQLVAQCTAQSVTSVQLEAQQTQVFILLKELSTWQAKVELYIVDKLSDYLFKQADQQASGPQFGLSTAVGFIVSLVLSASAYALVAAKFMLRLATDTVNSILDSFFPGGIKTNITAQLSRHNYSIEGKHAYGNKSEQFFWPCINCESKLYTDETVEAILQEKPWPLEMPQTTIGNTQIKDIYSSQPDCTTIKPDALNNDNWKTNVEYNIASCKGAQRSVALVNDLAYVIGTETFLPTVPFKNENIGEGEPVFTPPAVQDYVLDKNWNLMITAMGGDALWISCKDTKLFDGNYSNVVVSDTFCGIACSHTAIEVKPNIQSEYLRPWAVSPDAIAINVTGLNCAYEEKAYHAFDGYGYRITDWLGASGMNKEHYTLQYSFQVNDRFKRSNKLPPNQFMGNFQAVPNMSFDVKDDVFNQIQVTSEEQGLDAGVTGENKDQQRYAIPIFTEYVSTLPAIVKAHSSYKLAVIEGITSLTTGVRTSQTAYKLPVSIDFNINDQLFRMTNEYICSVKHEKGLEQVQYLVPALGLTYLGSTPFMAYFYNQATRQYFIYQGGNTLQAIDMLERFRDIKGGYYDFITQEVVMPCLATFSRLDKQIRDDDTETDNYIIPVFKHNKVNGEITPPITTIFKDKFRTISTPAGLVFQGPNRCIINRFVWSDYMLDSIRSNKGKWKKVPREEYHPFRQYYETYKNVNERLNDTDSVVKGWTHNPFLLVTSPIGVNEQTDCKFEWEITFAWTVEMEKIFEANEYVTVNVMAETMCPGGKVFSRPTHIFLHKELFTRSNNYGYYSFRYQSNNGAGNRERLHIWSDGYIAVSSLQLEYKVVTEKRNEILVTQEDIKGLKEM